MQAPAGPVICARCGADVTPAQAEAREFRCAACGSELAHLDLAPNGAVRAVLGWLRPAGTLLNGRYRIRRLLGKGGFAATYLVEDLHLNGKRRALKEVPEIFFDQREMEILSRIQHPCVPDITDRFGAEGNVYLVLEFGGDRTFESVREAAGGRVPLECLRPWLAQLCDGLAYLHAQQPPIVHRDLKPANILLDEADRVMLIDFGIAKEATPDAATRTIARSASHGFSPPEQVLGTGTDQRADVYALGATVYALLTGEVPPPAHERVAGAEIRPPRALVPELPPALEAALLRALELNVARRQASIEEFARDLAAGAAGPASRRSAPRTTLIGDVALAAAGDGAGGAAGPGPRARRRGSPALLAAAGAVALLAIGAAVWATLPRDGAPAADDTGAPGAGAAPASAALGAEPRDAAAEMAPAPAPPARRSSALQSLEAHRTQPSLPSEAAPEPVARAAEPPRPRRKPAEPPAQEKKSGWGVSGGYEIKHE